ncbi:MAG TPA: class I SAM-dependent methyltransferase, partial [Tepidisphaeraceae bacterium]
MASLFGQGINVDRDRPHIFHRDYWPLKVIRQGVLDFAEQLRTNGSVKTCLDYGAGVSPYAKHFQDRGIRVICADINPADASIVKIDAETGRVDLLDESVDAILSTQVLEHVPEVNRYLREAVRLLRPGGLMFLSTHGMCLLHRHPTDLWRWTVDGLRYELERAGLVVHNVTPKIGMLSTSTYCRSTVY